MMDRFSLFPPVGERAPGRTAGRPSLKILAAVSAILTQHSSEIGGGVWGQRLLVPSRLP